MILGHSLDRFGFSGDGYKVVKQKRDSHFREEIAKISLSQYPAPSWIHDFPITENYVIVPETPVYFNMLVRAVCHCLYILTMCSSLQYLLGQAYLTAVASNSRQPVVPCLTPSNCTFTCNNCYVGIPQHTLQHFVTAVVNNICYGMG